MGKLKDKDHKEFDKFLNRTVFWIEGFRHETKAAALSRIQKAGFSFLEAIAYLDTLTN